MANITTSSKRFTLNLNDFWKGLIMAVLGAVAGAIQGLIETGEINWQTVWKVGVSAAIVYLTKNFFDKPKIVVTDVRDDTIQGVKDGSIDVKLTTK